MSDLFRKEALSRLSDPEELDELFAVTSPRAWILLISLIVLLVIGIFWSVFGSVSMHVTGKGVLIAENEAVYEVSVHQTGRVLKLYKNIGDRVEKGEMLATIEARPLKIELEAKLDSLNTARDQFKVMQKFVAKDNQLAREKQKQIRTNLEQLKKNTEIYLEYLGRSVDAHKQAYKEDIVTEMEFAKAQNDLYQAQNQIKDYSQKILSSQLEEDRLLNQNSEKLNNLKEKILNLQNEVESITAKLNLATEVKSPVAGILVDLMTKQGDMVKADHMIASIEPEARHIDAVVYVKADDATRLRKGMKATVSPSGIPKEEFGAIEGVVKSVGFYPATKDSMFSVIGNDQLISSFVKDGPVVVVRLDLYNDPNTVSGLKWTNKKGPKIKIATGTIATGSIKVRSKPPIYSILPSLEKVFS